MGGAGGGLSIPKVCVEWHEKRRDQRVRVHRGEGGATKRFYISTLHNYKCIPMVALQMANDDDLTSRSQQPRSLLQHRNRLFFLRRRHTKTVATRLHRFQNSPKQQLPSSFPRSRSMLFIRRLGSIGDCRDDCCRGRIAEKNREAQGYVGHGPLREGDARQLYRSRRGVRYYPPSVALCTLSSRSKSVSDRLIPRCNCIDCSGGGGRFSAFNNKSQLSSLLLLNVTRCSARDE